MVISGDGRATVALKSLCHCIELTIKQAAVGAFVRVIKKSLRFPAGEKKLNGFVINS